MEQNLPKANITEDQYNKLIAYLEDARGRHMNMLYASIAGSVILTVPGLIVLGSIQYNRNLGMTGYAGNRSTDFVFILWLFCLAATVVLFLTGFQRKFGSQCPLSRVKRREFTCENITVGQLSTSEGKPPYLMMDSLGTSYVCPIFLEYKQLKTGMPAIGIFLADGTRFAVHNAALDTY